jgi:hypothetical protein
MLEVKDHRPEHSLALLMNPWAPMRPFGLVPAGHFHPLDHADALLFLNSEYAAPQWPEHCPPPSEFDLHCSSVKNWVRVGLNPMGPSQDSSAGAYVTVTIP